MIDDLPAGVRAHYHALKVLPDGRIVGICPLLFHWTLHVDIDPTSYRDRYCYQTQALAQAAFDAWSGEGEPQGWHRHPHSGRRRPEGKPELEYISF